MKIPGILLLFFFILPSSYAQNCEEYTFQPVQELKRHQGLQDPFTMPDGKRVSTKEEWQKQRQ